MKNILSLSAKEARDFFLKEESYFNFDLPSYFQFGGLLEKISKNLESRNLSDYYNSRVKPQNLEDVNYKLITNKDGRYAWRPFQLIHPVLYVSLVHTVTKEENWNYLKSRFQKLIQESKGIKCTSLPICSTYFKKDKAALIIQWLDEVEKRSLINSLEYDYLYQTDITDCYGSIYTHTVSWALHGKEKAKKEKGDKKLIGNVIDKQLQAMSNGQTNGIPQGSVLMDFLAEAILCYIDSLLTTKILDLKIKRTDYRIIRYRDDYKIFVNNPQIAERIIKELVSILNDFGMKINSSKTERSDNIVRSSIKPDKLYFMISGSENNNLRGRLFYVSEFARKFPNSGTIIKMLSVFFDDISSLSKRDIREDVKVLISIIVDIAYKNPRTYPIASAILSKLVNFLSKKDKEQIMKMIIYKFNKIPNTGIMQIWLQRINIDSSNFYEFSEKLCLIVNNINVNIWNSNWLNKEFKQMVDSYDLINRDRLKKAENVISKEEIELFGTFEYFP